MEYVRSYSSFLLVKKVPMEMESYISLRRTMFCTLSLGKNTSLGKDTQTQNKPMETTYSADPKSGCAWIANGPKEVISGMSQFSDTN